MGAQGVVVMAGQGSVWNVSPGRSLPFLYTPAGAGGLIEEQQRMQSTTVSMNEREKAEQRERYGWEIVGPNPL
jgi:hypothetical protein